MSNEHLSIVYQLCSTYRHTYKILESLYNNNHVLNFKFTMSSLNYLEDLISTKKISINLLEFNLVKTINQVLNNNKDFSYLVPNYIQTNNTIQYNNENPTIISSKINSLISTSNTISNNLFVIKNVKAQTPIKNIIKEDDSENILISAKEESPNNKLKEPQDLKSVKILMLKERVLSLRNQISNKMTQNFKFTTEESGVKNKVNEIVATNKILLEDLNKFKKFLLETEELIIN